MRRRCRRIRCRGRGITTAPPIKQEQTGSKVNTLKSTPAIDKINKNLGSIIRALGKTKKKRRQTRTRSVNNVQFSGLGEHGHVHNQCNKKIDLDKKFKKEIGEQTVVYHNNAPIKRPNGKKYVVELFKNKLIQGNATFSDFDIPYTYSGLPSECSDYGMAVLEMHFKTFETGQLSPWAGIWLNKANGDPMFLAGADVPGTSFFDDGNDKFPMEKEITHLRNSILTAPSSGVMKFITVPLNSPLFPQFQQMRVEVCARIVFYKNGRIKECKTNTKRKKDEELLNNPPDVSVSLTAGTTPAKLLFFNPLAPNPALLYNKVFFPGQLPIGNIRRVHLELDVEELGFLIESRPTTITAPTLLVLLNGVPITVQLLQPGFDPLSLDTYAWNPVNGFPLLNKHVILDITPYAAQLASGGVNVFSFAVLFGQTNPLDIEYHHMSGQIHFHTSPVPLQGGLISYASSLPSFVPIVNASGTFVEWKLTSKICGFTEESPSGANKHITCVEKLVLDNAHAVVDIDIPGTKTQNVTFTHTNINEETVTTTDDATNMVIHHTEEKDQYPTFVFIATHYNGTFGDLNQGFYFDCNFKQHYLGTFKEKSKGCREMNSREESEVSTDVWCELDMPGSVTTWFGNSNYGCYKNQFSNKPGQTKRDFTRQWFGRDKVLTEYNKKNKHWTCLGTVPASQDVHHHTRTSF